MCTDKNSNLKFDSKCDSGLTRFSGKMQLVTNCMEVREMRLLSHKVQKGPP